jgi:hypothetical protein
LKRHPKGIKGNKGDLFKKSPLTPLLQRGESVESKILSLAFIFARLNLMAGAWERGKTSKAESITKNRVKSHTFFIALMNGSNRATNQPTQKNN